jgi:hypothetical protein
MSVPTQKAANGPHHPIPAVREHRLRVLVTLDPAAPEHVALCYLDGSPAHCVVQPRHRAYLPAVLTRDQSSRQPATAAVLSIPLADGEAGVLFPAGHRFTIWADAVVGQTVRGKGLVGHGIRCHD